MSNSINDILRDLYQIDPSLRAHDANLRQLVAQLQAAQPQVEANALMASQLRARLAEMSMSRGRRMGWSWWLMPVAAAAVVVVVAMHPKTSAPTLSTKAGGVQIHAAAPEAFGAFRGATTTTQSSGLGTTIGSKDTATSPSMALPVDYTISIFSYPGTIHIPDLAVLRRDGAIDGNSSWATGGLFDRLSFPGLTLNSVTATQSTTDGYSVTMDYAHGTVSMYRQNDGLVKALTADQSSPTTSGTISDEVAITAATDFLAQHGISTADYGTPVVPKGPTMNGVPQPLYGYSGAMVLFPLSLNGYQVVDSSGFPYGLQVSVDNNRVVQSVSNIQRLSFVSSKYTLLSHASEVTSYLARGGWQWSSVGKDAKTTTYTVEDPSVVYMYSSYQLASDQNDYLVPALRFGVKPADQAAVGRVSVVVPLLSDLLQPPTDTIVAPASGSGSSTSGGGTTPSSSSPVAPAPTK